MHSARRRQREARDARDAALHRKANARERAARDARDAREDAVFNRFASHLHNSVNDAIGNNAAGLGASGSADDAIGGNDAGGLGASKVALFRAWSRLFPSAGRRGVADVDDVLRVLDQTPGPRATLEDAEAQLFRVTGFEGGPLTFAHFADVVAEAPEAAASNSGGGGGGGGGNDDDDDGDVAMAAAATPSQDSIFNSSADSSVDSDDDDGAEGSCTGAASKFTGYNSP